MRETTARRNEWRARRRGPSACTYRHRSEDAQAAEAARLEALLAALEVGDGALAALEELDLLLRSEGEVQHHRRRDDQDVRLDAVARHAVLANLDGLVHAEAANALPEKKEQRWMRPANRTREREGGGGEGREAEEKKRHVVSPLFLRASMGRKDTDVNAESEAGGRKT